MSGPTHVLNWQLGWWLVLLAFVTGAGLGLFFHRDNFLGGYNSFRRRIVRLGHIALAALGMLNVIFSYSPWPLTAFTAYAPLFLVAAGIGALIVAALVLLGTVAKREDPYYERPTEDGGPSAGSGDIT